MYKIELKNKTGFNLLEGQKIKVLDENKKLFYSFIFRNKKKVFNLPKGIFLTENKIEKLNYPVIIPLLDLPESKRNFNINNYKIVIRDTNKKAFVNHIAKIIVIDPSLLKLPRLILEFILAHEKGHLFYHKQINADKWATNFLIKKGFNKSQILKAQACTIKELKRKEKFLKSI